MFNAACGGIGLVVSECHSIVSGQLLLRFVTCYASYGRGKEKNIISYNLVDTRERRVFTSGVMSWCCLWIWSVVRSLTYVRYTFTIEFVNLIVSGIIFFSWFKLRSIWIGGCLLYLALSGRLCKDVVMDFTDFRNMDLGVHELDGHTLGSEMRRRNMQESNDQLRKS